MKRNLTPEQEAARDERRKKFAVLIKRVEEMTDEQRATLSSKIAAVTVEGHVLSLHNQIMIALQCESATLVGGFRQWQAKGRHVKKGEHGIMIWIPAGSKKDGDTGASPQAGATEKTSDLRFFMGTIFDISQTEANA